jgi:phytoene dehydrogenase-like protein
MEDIETLEAQFRAELVPALRRAANGRSPSLFSLKEERPRSSSHKLRARALRIMELRQSYSVDPSEKSSASAYVMACLRWEHGSPRDEDSAKEIAKALLRELGSHAT